MSINISKERLRAIILRHLVDVSTAMLPELHLRLLAAPSVRGLLAKDIQAALDILKGDFLIDEVEKKRAKFGSHSGTTF